MYVLVSFCLYRHILTFLALSICPVSMKFTSNFVYTAIALLFAMVTSAHAADCQPTTDTYTTDAEAADGATAASLQYQVENSC